MEKNTLTRQEQIKKLREYKDRIELIQKQKVEAGNLTTEDQMKIDQIEEQIQENLRKLV